MGMIEVVIWESPRVGSFTEPGWIPAHAERLPQTRAALEYAQRIHAGQHRHDGAPFVQHPLEVGALLHRVGAADHVIAAGVLHDVIEKTDVTAVDLRELTPTKPASSHARSVGSRRL